MDSSTSTMADRIAQAINQFERKRTGHAPQSTTVVLNGDILVATMRGALSPGERAAAMTPHVAAQLQEFHRQTFASSCEPLRREIEGITGVSVRDASAELATSTGAVMQMFATGTIVLVFLLAERIADDAWRSDRQPGSIHS